MNKQEYNKRYFAKNREFLIIKQRERYQKNKARAKDEVELLRAMADYLEQFK